MTMHYEKNNNGKVIGKLARDSIKTSKMRNAFIAVTIILSVSLLMVMSLFTVEMKEADKRAMARAQHVIYYNLTDDQLHRLSQDSRVSYLTLGKRGQAVEIDNYKLAPVYADGNSMEIKTMNLLDGKLPVQENEVLVSRAYLEQIGKPTELGTEFTVTFLDGTTESFKVSGFVEGAKGSKQYTMVFSKAYAENGSQMRDIPYEAYVRLSGAEKMGKEECKAVIYSVGGDAGILREDMNPNDHFLDTLTADTQEIALAACVGVVVLLASVLVIYGVFYISVVGRIRQYGQLRTIGMTKKQVRRLVTREGIYLFAVSAPVGVIIGSVIAYFLKPDGWSFLNTLLVALLVLVIDLITVLISVRKPASIAASISPIEASKYSVYSGGRKKKTKKVHRRISPLHLAAMNSARNRKKVLMTVLSLGIGGVLFMAAATFVNSFDKEMYSRQGDFADSEYIVSFSGNALELSEYGMAGLQKNSPFTEALESQILFIPGVDGIRSNQATSVEFDYPKKDLVHVEDNISPFTRAQAQELEKYLEDGSLDYDAMLKGETILLQANSVVQEIYGWRFEVGDTLTLYFYNGDTVIPKEVKIAGMFSTDYPKPISGWFMMPQEVIQSIVPFNLDKDFIVSTEPSMELAVEEPLRALVDSNPNLVLSTLQEQREQDAGSIATLSATALGLALFIIAFSMINLVNTLITNILSKKQELAMLESIGMSRRQIRQMVLGEGMLLAAGNLLITLTIGTAAGYLICWAFGKLGVHYMIYQFPVFYVLAYAVILLLVPYLISKIALRSFEKETLVERLREAE